MPTGTGYDTGVHLSFQDVSVDCLTEPQVLYVRIKASKTDPFRTGVDIFVGKRNCTLSPVVAMLAYTTKRGSHSGPLFLFSLVIGGP